jgi:hypothetical protein
MKLKYVAVSLGTVWEMGSLFSLNLAVTHLVGNMGMNSAVVLVQKVTVRPCFWI